MFNDLAVHFYDQIASAYKTYRDLEKDDTFGRSRHVVAGVSAAIALYHFREHLPSQHSKTFNQVVMACPDYALIRDVTNAGKHKSLTKGSPSISSSDDVTEMTFVTLFEDDAGQYSDACVRVCVKLTDGSTKDLGAALTSVFNYWGNELVRIGAMNQFQPAIPREAPGSTYVSRQNAKNLNLNITQGLSFAQTYKLQKYDQALGHAVPVDLTGADLKFQVYKPPSEIELEGKNPNTGETVRGVLKLTEDQAIEFHQLETNEQRANFIKQLVPGIDVSF